MIFSANMTEKYYLCVNYKLINIFNLKFEELDLNYDILDALYDMRFDDCTPIQEQAIPIALEGHDILASAQTGTGKTAAFLLPILEMLDRKGSADNSVNALILMPTRELVQQVDQMLEGFAYYQDTTWVPIFGGGDGINFAQQQRALQKGGDIAIATPGRLLSLLRMGGIDLSKVEYLVLDEADRMLDIGFFDDIMEIVSHLPKDRQSLMFSATFPDDVAKLAKKILYNPKEIRIAVSKPAEAIAQYVCNVAEEQKVELLSKILKDRDGKSVIFFSSKDKVKRTYKEIAQSKMRVVQIHADLTQEERTQALLDFKNGKVDVLLATDLVARGIDVDGIDLVVNFDVPFHFEDYVHRIGRTARAGAKGEAIMFVSNRDKGKLRDFERNLSYQINILKVNGFDAKIEKETLKTKDKFRPRYKGRNPKRSSKKKD